MATNYPTALDSLTNPSSSDKLNSPAHASQHTDENDAIEALQAKVGIDESAVATSQDYKIRKGLGIQDNADAETITCDLKTKNIHNVNLGGNRTIALSNVDIGQVFILRMIQDATGSRVPTWFSTINWIGGSAPTLSTAANAIDVLGFICTDTDVYDGFIVGMELS